jgi:hypothetical protein
VLALQPQFATGPFEEVELSAGHWLIEEKPEVVVDSIVGHLHAQTD